MQRIFAIGDIHGCLDKLILLMKLIKINPETDLLVFIGDYIDRGEHSKEVVDYLVDIKRRFRHTFFLLGNHEQMLLEYLDKKNEEAFLYNGGDKTMRSYWKGRSGPETTPTSNSWMPEDHHDFYRSLLPYYERDEYIFVHAGLRNGILLDEQDLNDLIWIREEFFYSAYDFGKTVIFGHTPFPQPFIHNRRIGIDTGAVYGNRLTALELPAMRFYAA
ncbi:MAG: serine/threonine protein phosphatase [Deltaproteobacteria bacterium]|nr:serine/threonine protein phosphatase [Deltaproteobacteria bacterium]